MHTRIARTNCLGAVLSAALLMGAPASAQSPQQSAADATRYMALGDSVAAGFRAMPTTKGYPYLLYMNGTFDRLPHTLFCMAAVPGATSGHVLLHQVPQAVIPFAEGGFNPNYITLTVGGNDLLAILRFAATNPNPADIQQFAVQVLEQYAQNLGAILATLRQQLPAAKIFVSNQYAATPVEPLFPGTLVSDIIAAFNATLAQVLSAFPSNVYLVDVHEAFLGRNSLIVAERPHGGAFDLHLTNAGQRAMAQAFAEVIAANK
jgi:lysophospholipase L1-like esterase